MSIEVSGGGSVAVETEAMLEARRDLIELADRADEAYGQIHGVLDAAQAPAGPPAWLLAIAAREMRALARDADALARELDAAAEAYGWVERALLARDQLLAHLAGPAPAIDDAATALAASAARHGANVAGDPQFVRALRELADSVSLPGLLLMVQALPGGVLDETPVTVTQASAPQAVPAFDGFTDLATRIPAGKPGKPQVRVEKYELAGGERHWVVYSAGTIDWSLVPSSEPWDDTSNVVGVAGGSAGSSRAAVQALEQAGWKPGEPVLPVGHSQGGIVATAIATSGVAPVPMLVTFGSPTAGVRTTPGLLDVAVEHTDDPVPALGGSPRSLVDPRLLVREAAPAAGPGAGGLPAHAMTGYAKTAIEMDRSTDPRLVNARTTLTEFTGGQKATVTMWRGERVPATGGPGGSAGGR
ncbi:hypothetical protein [Gryllotalpicola koreensis]|uniref:Alpha/beta hydrolase n=1 Tax=Gryllotalpicola koreensis TaxID=993086 RepID=A0ABP7ZS81_9MICO